MLLRISGASHLVLVALRLVMPPTVSSTTRDSLKSHTCACVRANQLHESGFVQARVRSGSGIAQGSCHAMRCLGQRQGQHREEHQQAQ